MQTWKEIGVENWKENPFQIYTDNWALVTAAKKDGTVNSMTVSWGSAGTIWGVPAATVYIRDSRFTKEFIDEAETFSVSFPDPEKYRAAMSYMGKVSGRDADKLKEAKLSVEFAEGVPYICEADKVLICRKMCSQPIEFINMLPEVKEKWYPTDDRHMMYIGEVKKILVRA